MRGHTESTYPPLSGDDVQEIARNIIDDATSMQQAIAATYDDYVNSDVRLCKILRSARRLLAPLDKDMTLEEPLAGLVAYVTKLESGENKTMKELACTLAALEFAAAKIRRHMGSCMELLDSGLIVEA